MILSHQYGPNWGEMFIHFELAGILNLDHSMKPSRFSLWRSLTVIMNRSGCLRLWVWALGDAVWTSRALRAWFWAIFLCWCRKTSGFLKVRNHYVWAADTHHNHVWSHLMIPASSKNRSVRNATWRQLAFGLKKLWFEDLCDAEWKWGIMPCESETWLSGRVIILFQTVRLMDPPAFHIGINFFLLSSSPSSSTEFVALTHCWLTALCCWRSAKPNSTKISAYFTFH